MRRYAFYPAVALLAFGIGSIAVFKLYWITKEKPTLKEETKITVEVQKEETKVTEEVQTKKHIGFGTGYGVRQLNEPEYVPKLYKPTCSDRKLLHIWNELRKDKEFQQREAEGFYREADCEKMLDVKKIDLNDDGQKEIVLQGNNPNLCARDDCLIWIFERKGIGYKQILQSHAIGAVYVSDYTDGRGSKIDKTKSFGYKIITAKGGRGALAIERKYQFDGNQYRETECSTYEYSPVSEKPYTVTCEEKWKE